MVPEGWDFQSLGQLAYSIQNGFVGKVAQHYIENGIPYLMAKNVRNNKIIIKDLETVSSEFCQNNPRALLEFGDVVTVQSGHIGTTAVIPEKLHKSCCHALIITKVIQEKLNSHFLAYYFNSPPGRKRLSDIFIGTTIRHINTKDLRKFYIPTPPIAEQKKIAEILGSVDEAIAATQAVIDQTRKVKQGLLQQLLTRGIGHTKFKETAIGLIPESWEVKTAQEICSQISVGIVVRPSQYYVKSGIRCFRSANIQEGYIKNQDWVYISEESNQLLSKSKLRTGDVLIVRSGEPGISCVVTEEFDGVNCIDIIFARPDKATILPDFLSWFINSPLGKKQVLQTKGGLAQQHFNVGALNVMRVGIPSLDEQKKIVFIISELQYSISEAEVELKNLLKLKQGLMQDLLTGRVRVADC